MKTLNIKLKKEYFIAVGISLFICLPYKEILFFILDHAMFWLFAGIVGLIIYAYLGTVKERKDKLKLSEFKIQGGYEVADAYKKRFAKRK